MDKQEVYSEKTDFKDKALNNLSALFEDSDLSQKQEFSLSHDAFLQVLKKAAVRLQVQPEFPVAWEKILSMSEKLEMFCEYSNCTFREIELKGRWAREDFGPVIFFNEIGHPYYIEKRSGKKFIVYDGAKNEYLNYSAKEIGEKAENAIMMIKAFPAKSMSFRDIFLFAYKANISEFSRIWGLSVIAGLIALLFPLGVGLLFGNIIPSANKDLLVQLGLALLVITISRSLFFLSKDLLTTRLNGWMEWVLQTALIDRVLKLPVSFFREESSGSLANKVGSFVQIKNFFTSGLSQVVFSLFYAFFNLVLLYFFSLSIAFFITVLTVVYLSVLFVILQNEVNMNRQIEKDRVWISAMVLQFIKGLNKIKQAAAEWQVVSFWSHHFSYLKKMEKEAAHKRNKYNLIVRNITWLVQALVFMMVVFSTMEVGTGNFLGLNAAFFNLYLSLGTIAGIFRVVNHVIPAYDNVKPIFTNVPEESDPSRERIELKGALSFEDVCFSYEKSDQLILHNVSFAVKAGESVALVGPSGSGKSTLLRLMLGFEIPSSGKVLYEDKDLQKLNLKNVRQQLGVVLQNDQLMAGSIFENISGTQNINLDEAWKAADDASVKKDIEEMPMGMHTLVSDHASALSGGQKQRILIARALAGKPKMLFFDEATSALDNISQKVVSESLENLKVSRIIIAHRLSTIKNADKIIYLENGKILESGTFEELMTLKGRFYELAQRQIA